MAIANDRPNGLILAKNPNIFQNRNCPNRRLWRLSGDPPLALSIKAFSNLIRSSQPKLTASNYDRHWLINEIQLCPMTMHGHMLPRWQRKNSPSWVRKFCHIHHIAMIYLPDDIFWNTSSIFLNLKDIVLHKYTTTAFKIPWLQNLYSFIGIRWQNFTDVPVPCFADLATI